jgi:hypothetical protein
MFWFCWLEIINVYWQNRGKNGYLSSHQSLESMKTPLRLNTWLVWWIKLGLNSPLAVWVFFLKLCVLFRSSFAFVNFLVMFIVTRTFRSESMKTPLRLNTWLVWWIKPLPRLIKMNLIDMRIFFNTAYSVSKNNRLFSDCTFLSSVW